MKSFVKLLILTAIIFTLDGCRDDVLYRTIEIGEGEGRIDATVKFYPVVESLGTRATAGDAIENITSLSVVIYDQYKNFFRLYNSSASSGGNALTYELSEHTDAPAMSEEDANNKGTWSTEPQAQAKFTLPESIPFGKYYIFCVANMGELTRDRVETIDNLKNIQLTWNPSDIASNNQMFGSFTTAEEAADDRPIAGFDAEAVYVTKKIQPLHAWIKRAASKVTLEFDGSGLYQDVFIYINKATIKDIPATCLLGADNKPVKDQDELINGESIFYKYVKENTGDDSDDASASTQETGISDVDLSGEDFEKWLTISNGVSVKGSHEYDAPSMFFYENMQGDYEGQKGYNKQPDYSNVEQFIGDLHNNPTATDIVPSNYDTKDNVPMGTYIEVEGYYLSQNPNNVGSGPIKYRFMLGKNTTYNYNAQRNHHYKVTLKFKGWANQPEWHIDYVEDNPGLYVPDRFYMPYLYNKRADFPVKLNGKCTELKFEIIENGWGPRNLADAQVNPPKTWPATIEPSYGNTPMSYYDFVWNEEAWEKYNSQTAPYCGYFALTAPSDNPPAYILLNYSYSNSQAPGVLNAYYLGDNKGQTGDNYNPYPQNVRTFTDFSSVGNKNTNDQANYYNNIAINEYNISRVDENGCELTVPFFTRPKTMVKNSDFGGNNPYRFFIRYAKVKVTAKFRTANGIKLSEKYVDVFQVPRITNPKGVWRKSGSTESFDVVLTRGTGPAGNDNFEGIVSDGSWTAEVNTEGESGNFSIEGVAGMSYLQTTDKYIEGKTGSQVKFRINFKGATSACGIVTIRYHGGSCIHEIFLRQGYEPMAVTDGGAEWCTYNVFSAHDPKNPYDRNNHLIGSNASKGNDIVECTLVKSPLSIGSYFKKGNYDQGIMIENNREWGPLVPYNNTDYVYNFTIASRNAGNWSNETEGWKKLTWGNMYGINNTTPNNSNGSDDTTWEWARFKDTATGKVYRVPSYAEFRDITTNCDFGFGTLYGDGASRTRLDFKDAESFFDPYGTIVESTNGVRGVFVFNRSNAKQIFFTLGMFAQGRRTVFNRQGVNSPGVLRYGDVSKPLDGDNNYFRPIPYNLCKLPGGLYWTRKYQAANDGILTDPCGAWDINFFATHFNAYTDNNWKDAIPIKLVVDK